jgi:aspartyl-tRNA(Asn)/glutamyl-tRNA(Gln) amidotransferase subunit C
MNKEEIKKIADLARLEITDEESEKFASEIDSILQYIDQIKSADISDDAAESRIENAGVRNVMREDENPHDVSENTEALIKEAPDSQDDLIKVKKILNN